MPTLQYRCRRCDEFHDAVIGDLHMVDDALCEHVSLLNGTGNIHSYRRMYQYRQHDCPDGGRGILEIAGYTP